MNEGSHQVINLGLVQFSTYERYVASIGGLRKGGSEAICGEVESLNEVEEYLLLFTSPCERSVFLEKASHRLGSVFAEELTFFDIYFQVCVGEALECFWRRLVI